MSEFSAISHDSQRHAFVLFVLIATSCSLLLVRCGAPSKVTPVHTAVAEPAPTVQPAAAIGTPPTPMDLSSLDVKAMFDEGIGYYNARQFDQAIDRFVEILEMEPSNLNARSNLGAAYFNTGKLEDALREFELAHAQDPTDAEILYNLGATRLGLGDLNQAMQDFQNTVRMDPDLPDVHIGLGNAYIMQGDIEAGIEELEKALQLAPDAPWHSIIQSQIRSATQRAAATSLPPLPSPTSGLAPTETE